MPKKTTITMSVKTRNQIKEFGNNGETYEDIIARLLKSAKERQLHDLLMDDTDCITISEARKRAKKKWSRSG